MYQKAAADSEKYQIKLGRINVMWQVLKGIYSGIILTVYSARSNESIPTWVNILSICMDVIGGVLIAGYLNTANGNSKQEYDVLTQRNYSLVSNIRRQLAIPENLRQAGEEYLMWISKEYDNLNNSNVLEDHYYEWYKPIAEAKNMQMPGVFIFRKTNTDSNTSASNEVPKLINSNPKLNSNSQPTIQTESDNSDEICCDQNNDSDKFQDKVRQPLENGLGTGKICRDFDHDKSKMPRQSLENGLGTGKMPKLEQIVINSKEYNLTNQKEELEKEKLKLELSILQEQMKKITEAKAMQQPETKAMQQPEAKATSEKSSSEHAKTPELAKADKKISKYVNRFVERHPTSLNIPGAYNTGSQITNLVSPHEDIADSPKRTNSLRMSKEISANNLLFPKMPTPNSSDSPRNTMEEQAQPMQKIKRQQNKSKANLFIDDPFSDDRMKYELNRFNT
jgi:hypothetical protein